MIFRIFMLSIAVTADCESRNILENRIEVICKNLDRTYESGLKVKITFIKCCFMFRSYEILIMGIFFNSV